MIYNKRNIVIALLLCLKGIQPLDAMAGYPYASGGTAVAARNSYEAEIHRAVRFDRVAIIAPLICMAAIYPASGHSLVCPPASHPRQRHQVARQVVTAEARNYRYARSRGFYNKPSKLHGAQNEGEEGTSDVPDFNVWYHYATVWLASVVGNVDCSEIETREQLDELYGALKPLIMRWHTCAQVVNTRAWYHLDKKYAHLECTYADRRCSIKTYAHALLSCVRALAPLVMHDGQGLLVDQVARKEVRRPSQYAGRRKTSGSCRRDVQDDLRQALADADGYDNDDDEWNDAEYEFADDNVQGNFSDAGDDADDDAGDEEEADGDVPRGAAFDEYNRALAEVAKLVTNNMDADGAEEQEEEMM